MIELLECTCIEAYKARKMRDPNCCACSCDHNDLVEQLAKANERVDSLQRECIGVKNFLRRYRYRFKSNANMQGYIDDVLEGKNGYLNEAANKFAIEKKIEAIDEAIAQSPSKLNYALPLIQITDLYDYQEQLRKEQEK